MEIAVVGVGGVGGFLGGKLASAFAEGDEHRVYFMARGAHLEAIRRRGLCLITRGKEVHTKPWDASEGPAAWPRMDAIFICVKGPELQSAALQIKPCLGPETVVIPLQNGIAKREFLEGILPHGRVADGCIYVSAHIQAPGVVLHAGGPGRVVIGRDPEDMDLLIPHRDFLLDAGIQTELVPQVEVEIWNKYLFICALSGAMALFREPLGPIMSEVQKRDVLVGLMREVEALARARGIPLSEEIVPRTLDVCHSFPLDSKSSLLLDLEQRRTNELDWLFGPMIQEGERLGLPLPVTNRVYRDIRSVWSLPSDPTRYFGSKAK